MDTTFESEAFNEGLALLKEERTKEALGKFRAASAQYPDWPQAWHNVATCLRRLGRSVEAVAAYRQVLEIAPTFVATLNDLAILLKKLGDVNEALRLQALAIIHTTKGKEYTYYNYAHTLAMMGKTDAAVENYRASIAINNTYAPAHYNLGSLLKRQGNLEEAAVSFREALHCDADHSNALFQLATTLSILKRLDEAIPLWEQYLSVFPNDSAAFASLGGCVLARAIETNNPHMLGRCRTLLFKALRCNPLNLRAWLLLREYVTT